MRVGVLTAVGVLACAGSARAEPRLEASGYVGIDWFGDNIQLGNSWAKDQVPSTAPLIGGRISYLAAELPHDLQLAVEAELAVAPAFTGYSGGRMSYFAPVFEWHVHGLLRLARWAAVQPHLVVGGGGETVASQSPYMAKETDPIVYWGPGVAIPVSESWLARIDLRHGIMPAREGSATSTIAIELGVATTFGMPPRRATRMVPAVPVQPPVDESDRDGDGIPDRLDACPDEPETVNGVSDDDGCPELDPDGDGIIGAADKCPDKAEDFDGFQDEDGCPDPDNDNDGIEDSRDQCPLQPETKNGYQDEDGCPDEVPADLAKSLAVNVPFEPTRARVTDPAGTALAPVLVFLMAHPDVHIAITGHPERAGGEDLAKRRADAVKWYLVDQGIVAGRIATSVGAIDKAPLTFAIVPR